MGGKHPFEQLGNIHQIDGKTYIVNAGLGEELGKIYLLSHLRGRPLTFMDLMPIFGWKTLYLVFKNTLTAMCLFALSKTKHLSRKI
tara:strand:- start:233 stop:490 length:258 start_codon:yes stop_codon:yes gene_type:complete